MYKSCLIITVIFLQIACSTSAQETIPQRKPLKKNSITFSSPKNYAPRNLENGAEYDPKPRVIVVDEKAKKYELRWIGYDGKEKVVEYQGYDAIDVVVRANTKKEKDIFIYNYSVENLTTSSTFLSKFIVQNFASKINSPKLYGIYNGIYVGKMSNLIPQFKEGDWISYGILSGYKTKVSPGKTIELSLSSPALPGIIGCRAVGGEIALKGAGEHMPSELEDVMPGFEQLPYGYTIGPIDRLAIMSKDERAKYFVENLDKFQEAGWITETTAKKYESILENADLTKALKQAEKDLADKFITIEIFSIIEGLNS